jgi:hypothetical protein
MLFFVFFSQKNIVEYELIDRSKATRFGSATKPNIVIGFCCHQDSIVIGLVIQPDPTDFGLLNL